MSNRIIKQRVIALACDTVRLKLAEFSLRSLATPSVELIKVAASEKSFAVVLDKFEPGLDPT